MTKAELANLICEKFNEVKVEGHYCFIDIDANRHRIDAPTHKESTMFEGGWHWSVVENSVVANQSKDPYTYEFSIELMTRASCDGFTCTIRDNGEVEVIEEKVVEERKNYKLGED